MNLEPATENRELVLYSGPHCSLCEKAKQIIWPVLAVTGHHLREVDITTDVELLRRYRQSIPVLSKGGGAELTWPFDERRLRAWLHNERF